MPTVEWNLKVWNAAYGWEKDGDEWSQQAEFCGVPYDRWKDQIRRTFILPYIRPESTMLEIGPGHGRWSAVLAHKVAELHLVDLSPSCIEFCRKRLSEHANVRYHVNDGRSLSMIPDSSIDFVWSFDTFVHIEEDEVRAYAKELKRVMRHQAMGAIHHPGSPTPDQRQAGMRSMIDSRKFSKILMDSGLHMIMQTGEWAGGCNMALTGDAVTTFAKP